MIDVDKLKNKGISDNEIQDILSIQSENFTIIELVNPRIVHDKIVIAYSHTYPIIVKAEGIFIYEEHGYRFVNSNTKSFLNCLAQYAEYCRNIALYENDDESRILELVKNYIRKIETYDPKAFNNENFFWVIVAQQMIDGNL